MTEARSETPREMVGRCAGKQSVAGVETRRYVSQGFECSKDLELCGKRLVPVVLDTQCDILVGVRRDATQQRRCDARDDDGSADRACDLERTGCVVRCLVIPPGAERGGDEPTLRQ